MSETIQGTKSSLYVKEQIPGIDNSSDYMTHQSVQNLWNSRGASDVMIHGVFVTGVGLKIEIGSVKRRIKITAHGAFRGDFLKIYSGVSDGAEVSIVKIINANEFIIATEVDASVGDDCFILKPVTPSYNKDGSLNVVAGPNPGASTTANQVLEITQLTNINTALAKSMKSFLYYDYSSVNVTNAAYVQLIASTALSSRSLTWMESGGYPMVVAIGAIGLEVDLFVVPPGGFNGEISIPIPAGSRVSIKCLQATVAPFGGTVSVGSMIANFLG